MGDKDIFEFWNRCAARGFTVVLEDSSLPMEDDEIPPEKSD